MSPEALASRLAAVEDRLAIGQLPIRYALAVDGRDIESWVNLFVPDVDCGRYGRGREALRDYITPQVKTFYRSIHLICGHRVELIDATTAWGKAYCRAEHEVGEKWEIMAICYDDHYTKVDGEWLFQRRTEQHWYTADQLSRPQQAGSFVDWHTEVKPALPHAFPAWGSFWADVDTTAVTARA
ncbi:nuclear transport factor 2 family protein [Mycolicibacterium fluoranthenivorans]|uniref:Nuclear transport factor 2 family protein n=1 Tax=Mycolicibacterium fluoranthenivorans TaxID=258505 RepID=A0A7G8PG47_9MYCO|nr:nuclear transport factor 2 family protein [Mycolicibacterium fluoranthenivorans]QNJ93313.1 nuclear transport factor 2 family protein [Mycolicibacterium fluoranthenivorans]